MPASPSSSTSAILAELQDIRVKTARQPRHVVELGTTLIERGWTSSGGDEVWTFFEQVGAAAVECGNYDLAETCASRLSAQFPDSPRVAVLLGTILEGQGRLDEALALYHKQLELDEADLNIRKRLISLHLYSGVSQAPSGKGKAVVSSGSAGLSRETGVDMLVEYLDTFYNDVEGWAQLASVYASMQLYAQSLSALSHVILLAPQNPYHLLRHAETAYTLGDVALAYKEFLRVIEISNGVASAGGVGRRTAIGAKLCISRLRSLQATPADPLLKPMDVDKIDLLVSKLVLDTYSCEGAQGAAVVRKWVGGEL